MKCWTVLRLENLRPGESMAFYRGSEALVTDIQRNHHNPNYAMVLSALKTCAEDLQIAGKIVVVVREVTPDVPLAIKENGHMKLVRLYQHIATRNGDGDGTNV
jgi:hypothetical protein